jgi:DNA polymerase III delta prime subunit
MTNQESKLMAEHWERFISQEARERLKKLRERRGLDGHDAACRIAR